MFVLLAHVLGAAAIGALDSARLGSLGIAFAAIPMFALLGLLAGLASISAERAVAGRPWWVAALGVASPGLVVFVPVAASLFEGAYAQTLPLAGAAPVLLPIVLWLGAAAAIAGGRKLLAGGDLASRAIVIVALAGTIGTIVWVERNILKTGYPAAHIGATVMISVLAGLAIRVTRRPGTGAGATDSKAARRRMRASYALAAGVVIVAIVAALGGLHDANDRRTLATFGDQTRDLVALWRMIIDVDRDGSSKILGGGDCDDLDGKRHPGAIDIPADGIDQDCDGVDAKPFVADAGPRAEDAAQFRDRPEVRALLERTRGMNVLMLSVDALRADLIAPDAAHRDEYPHITKLLAESVWFTRAFAPATGTDISLSTLLTGRSDPFQPVATTLPEALRAGGRKTYAVIPAEVLRYAGETMIGRGVDKLVKLRTDAGKADVGDHISAPKTTSEGLRAIDDAGGAPWFVWVHYFDVHEAHQIKVPPELMAKVTTSGSEKARNYRALLKAIDDEIGKLLGELVSRGVADKTIVVFASDHGESLGEDPRLLVTHGKVAYAPLVRIPIALRIPGLAAGQRTDLVSLVDLAPTLLDLLGIIPDDMPLDGKNLLATLLDGPPALRPVGRALAIHEQEQWSVVEWPYQLLVRPADDLVELYDLDKDPLQKSDLSATLPEVVSRLKSRYASFPQIVVDRTPAGRSARERIARQRPSREPR